MTKTHFKQIPASVLSGTALVLMGLVPTAAVSQPLSPPITFDEVPVGVEFVGGDEVISLQGDTIIAGELNATGVIVSEAGIRFSDGTLQTTASGPIPGASANQGLYSNRIGDLSLQRAFTEICFKNGSMAFDIHGTGESTLGGDCVPGDIGWILERFERDSAVWTDARVGCLADDLRLPEPFEWQYACDQAAIFALDSMVGNFEWASNTANAEFTTLSFTIVSAAVFGGVNCATGGASALGTSASGRGSHAYRCAR